MKITVKAALSYALDALRVGIIGPSPEVVGVDLAGDTVSTARVRRDRTGWTAKVSSSTASSSPDAPPSNQVKPMDLSRARIAAVVPRHLLTVRLVRLPSHDESVLKEMVSYEATQMVPHDAEQLTVAHRIAERCDDGSSLVTIAVAETGTLERFMEKLQNHGIKPDLLIPSMYALQHVYARAKPTLEADTDNASDQVVGLVLVDEDRLEVDNLKDGELRYSRGIPLKVGADSATRLSPPDLADEVKRSVAHGVRTDGIVEPKRLLVTGNGEMSLQMQDSLRQEDTAVEPLDLSCNGSHVHVTAVSPDTEPNVLAIGAGIAAIEPGASSINLLPTAFARRKVMLHRWRLAGTAGFLFLMCLASMAGVVRTFQHRQEQRLARLKSMIREVRSEAGSVQRLKDRLDVLQSRLNATNSPLELLARLHTVAPQNLALDTFHYEASKKLVITGQAEAPSAVWELREAIAGSRIFGDVNVLYVSTRSVQGAQVAAFKIECSLGRPESQSKDRRK